jgi:hypothetical protein
MADLWTGSVGVTITFQFEYEITECWEATDEEHVIELVTAEAWNSIDAAWLDRRERMTMTLTRDEEAT